MVQIEYHLPTPEHHVLRLSKLTDYATVLLAAMARAPEAVHNTTELARATRVSAPTVRKTLKLLARGGLVESVRGARGGYHLQRPASSISMADVITAIEGPIGMTECSVASGQCALEPHCRIRSHWQIINRKLVSSLKQLSLADLNVPVSNPGA